jgi:hypothetical protein
MPIVLFRSDAGRAARPAGLCVGIALCGAVGCKDGSGAGDGLTVEERRGHQIAMGAALYVEMCAVCHGAAGQGTSGPRLRDLQRGEPELIATIRDRMPPGQPGRCDARCAERIAAYLKSGFSPGEPACSAGRASPPPRRLRLLSRREYRNTVAALLATPAAPSCAAPTFSYAPAGRALRSVHVAGSFNGWPGTVAAGGWPLAYDGGRKLWTLTQKVPNGTHQYKLVLDEKEWIADPTNPSTAPDGFGGQNSVLTVTCQPGDPGPAMPSDDVAARLVPDARPDGFPFDDHAAARVVTAVHAEEYHQAAQKLAEQATNNALDPKALERLVGCDYGADKAAACGADFVRRFGQRAFRRPLRPEEEARYLALLRGRPSFAEGVKATVAALLQSPHFLYRSELGEAQPDGSYRLTDYEAASALSYFLWAGPPDAALYAAADSGELRTAAGLERQARRLLADDKAQAQVAEVLLQWLGADAVLQSPKSAVLFPAFDDTLRRSLAEETRRFVRHALFEDDSAQAGTLAGLLLADYSFLNDALARHYGVAGSFTAALRKQALTGSPRAGLLGHGSVLASYAHSDQSSPIKRGLFIRRRLLCQELPAPPPNAGGVPKVDPTATTRERFRQHSDSPFCRSCHRLIDPVGFGLERFDAVGAYRERENSLPIDSDGDLGDLEVLGADTHAPYHSLRELAQLLAGSERAHACLSRQLLRYAHGQLEDVAEDLCALRAVKKRFDDSGRRIPELLVAITQLPEFVLRAAPTKGGAP